MNESGYRSFLKTKYVPQLITSMTLARLPVGVVTIVLVIFVNMYYSASISGIATAAFMGGMAIIAPIFGRKVDKGYGPAMLYLTAFLELVSVFLLTWAVTSQMPVLAVLVTALTTGAFMPPVAAVTRSLWPVMLDISLISTAYNLDLLIIDALYVGGPLLASIFVGLGIPELGLILTTIGSSIGAAALARIVPVRECAHHNKKRSQALDEAINAIKAPLFTIPIVLLMLGLFSRITFAAWLETVIPLFYTNLNNAMLGSIVISAWSIGSVAGGVLFNRFQPSPRIMSTPAQLVSFTAIVLVVACIVPFCMSFIPMCAILSLVGITVATTDNLYYQIAGNLTAHERQGEMFSWMNTASNVGLSAGAFLAGMSVEHLGFQASFALPTTCVIASFIITIAAFFAIKSLKKNQTCTSAQK